MPDYTPLDQSPLLGLLFYPRRDFTPCPHRAWDFFVPVDPGISLSCRFYVGDHNGPWILFFHGNGEVVSDYDDIAPFYHKAGINLVVADYRGYGASGGSPTFTNLVGDAPRIFSAVKEEISQKGSQRDLWIMGRSMGSISALEIAHQRSGEMKGLIMESGFASVTRLIKHLGLPSRGLNLGSIDQDRINIIRQISAPALIIHGERDRLVPLKEGQELFAALGSTQKNLVIIPKADHNDILFTGGELYFRAIRDFVEKTK